MNQKCITTKKQTKASKFTVNVSTLMYILWVEFKIQEINSSKDLIFNLFLQFSAGYPKQSQKCWPNE